MSEIKIFTQLDRPKTEEANPGTRFLDLFQEQINKNGSLELVKVGQRNVYEEIQTHLEETKIENILHALAMGDLSVLQQREATYCDATTMPKTLMEAQNIVIKAKQEFSEMPLEVRKLFNNSAEEYVSQMGTKEFLDKLAPYNKKMSDIREAGNLEAYNKKVAEQAKFEQDVANAKGVNTNEQKQ